MAPTHRVSSLRGLLAFGWRLGLSEPSGELHKCFWMFFSGCFWRDFPRNVWNSTCPSWSPQPCRWGWCWCKPRSDFSGWSLDGVVTCSDMHRTNLSPKSSIQKLFWIGSTMFYCWSTKKNLSNNVYIFLADSHVGPRLKDLGHEFFVAERS